MAAAYERNNLANVRTVVNKYQEVFNRVCIILLQLLSLLLLCVLVFVFVFKRRIIYKWKKFISFVLYIIITTLLIV